jgi:molecular chaperone HscB
VSLTNRNYFEFFSLPKSFQVDADTLEREYKKLQTEYHPDKFADASESERVQVLQHASLINDAYDTVKSPLKRAAYLLRLENIDPEEHNQSHLQEAFLLQQIELREDLEMLTAKKDLDGLEKMKETVISDRNTMLQNFEVSYLASELIEAKSLYNSLQFLFKLVDEIEDAEEKLLDY